MSVNFNRGTAWVRLQTVVVGVILLLPASAYSGPKEKGPSQSKGHSSQAPIREEMSGLFMVTSEILPLVLDKQKFESKKNAKIIRAQMLKLKALSEKMASKSKRFEDSDPSIRFVSERFAEDINYAIDIWDKGGTDVTRGVLRNVTDYCITCHTRTSKGAHFNSAYLPKGFASMPLLSRAEYLAATRQFDEALKLYEHILSDRPLAQLNPGAWAESVRKTLAISVRVKDSPHLALEMISRVQDSPESVLPAMTAEIAEWRVAAKAWIAEKPKALENDDAKRAEASRLLKEAEIAERKVKGAGLIQNLRASAILHELLSRTQGGEGYQELLFMAGNMANSLKGLNLWTMQDAYFERCIRIDPNSSLAKKCYDNYESSLLRSYGASSKANLPEFIQNRLDLVKQKK